MGEGRDSDEGEPYAAVLMASLKALPVDSM